ncbi:Uncharacterized protein PCOAH_00040410 [Plasmodium coatneyi]|uniref:KIR protein n=1 Tax=Plasmodium coatneyi TaxID=208452 RepID=A0A1B1E420_9APIC|nr:Uncharacterized protein PCOAH_00040410 [Plasmodium coatneyi]ANQ09763.1 Uncharacterized protein PCOAH_00040410 [Plasmodium coatneyi]
MFVGELPSRAAYDAFDQKYSGYYGCNTQGVETESAKIALQTALQAHDGIKAHVDKILEAYCYASSPGGTRSFSSRNKECTFFYYWLGTKVWECVSDSDSFQTLMKNIYDQLKEIKPSSGGESGGGGCTILYSGYTINKDLFPKAKIVSDYSLDYTKIVTTLPKNKEDYCPAYEQYLKAAATAYTNLCTQSTESSETGTLQSSVCGDFIARAGGSNQKPNPQKLISLHCEAILNRKVLQTELRHDNQVQREAAEEPALVPETTSSSGENITTTTVSSILGATGMLSVAFLLYKHKPFFFKRNNHIGVGRRKKRSAIRSELNTLSDEEDDTLTENDTLTTEYSTENSTFDGTVYDTESTRTYSRQQQRRQQQHQQRRNNIHYQHM